MSPTISRRHFLGGVAASGALGLAASLESGRIFAFDGPADTAADAGPLAPNAFVSIDETGLVSVTVHRSEMGQGSRVTLAVALADELGADWARVRILQAPGDKKYGKQDTDGSHSIRDFLQSMREMGATARQMLEAAAASEWEVPMSEVETRVHEIAHLPSGKTLAFGALVAKARAIPVPAPADLTLRPIGSLPHLGKKLPMDDRPAVTTGTAIYGIDATLPGMKFAVIARPPVYGGKVLHVDSREAEKVPGVERVIALQGTPPPSGFRPLGGIAVVASNTWAAIQGREKLSISWDDGPNATYDSKAYRADLERSTMSPGRVVRSEGDAEGALASAARRVSASYYVPHLAHAPMEPPAALARFADGACEAWGCTQDPQSARNEIAAALGISADRVAVHATLLGGGFGRKSKPDFLVEAALLSREAGAPVKVTWTREDEIRHGFYHTVAAVRIEAGLDASGKATAWRHRSAFPAIGSTFAPNNPGPSDQEMALGASDLPFAIPNVRVEACDAPAHVRIGWFRSVCNIPNAFAVCSFVDELAAAAGRDPKEYLLELIGPPRRIDLSKVGVKDWNYGEAPSRFPLDTGRMRHVVELVAERAGWGRTLPKGEGLGIAVHRSFLSVVATVVHARVAGDGALSIPAVWTAVDCGFPANPDRIRSQMEGAAVMGVSLALYGSLTFEKGRAVQSNFNDFPVALMGMAPRTIDVQIVPSEDLPAGVGEPGLPPFAPALANAIYAATGKRLRTLPIGDRLAL
jgi:isoquinoline 1-oxidoreductase subunit beta